MPGEGRPSRVRTRLLIAVIAIFAIVIVFALPWLVPVKSSPVVSDAQATGFSNRTAMVGIVVACAAMASVAFVARRRGTVAGTDPMIEWSPVAPKDRVDKRLVIALAGLAMVLVAAFASISRTAPWGDASYFMNAVLRTAAGGRPYSEIGFAYGPLLLYGPLLSWRLLGFMGVNPYAAYYTWVAGCHVAGLLLGAYVLNRLHMSRRTRNEAFVVLGAFDIFQFHLGPNYTWFRFLLAFACLLWVGSKLTDRSSRFLRYAAAPLAVLLVASVSPEMGVALFVALVCVFVLSAAGGSKASLAPLLILFAAGAIMVGVLPQGSVRAFADGALNFPVLPGLPAVAFVVTMLAVAFGVGSMNRRLSDPTVALSAGWFVLSLALVAPAFGRADFGHIFWNGAGAFLLCAAVVEIWWQKGRQYVRSIGLVFVLAAGIYAVTCFGAIFEGRVTSGVFSQESAVLVAKLAGKPESSGRQLYQSVATARPTAQECAQLVRLPQLAFTEPLLGELGLRLAESGNLVPLYSDPTQCLDQEQFALTMAQLARAKTLAVPSRLLDEYSDTIEQTSTPEGDYVMAVPEEVLNQEMNGSLFWFPVRMHGKNAVFDPTASFIRVLNRDWREVGRTEHYVLLGRSARSADAVTLRVTPAVRLNQEGVPRGVGSLARDRQ